MNVVARSERVSGVVQNQFGVNAEGNGHADVDIVGVATPGDRKLAVGRRNGGLRMIDARFEVGLDARASPSGRRKGDPCDPPEEPIIDAAERVMVKETERMVASAVIGGRRVAY